MITLIAAAAIAAQEPPPRAELGEIRAFLMSNRTGQLSEDLSPPAAGGHWNRVIEGDDIVITAEVRTDGQQFIRRALRIVARARGGRILNQRVHNGILTTTEGRAYQPLYLLNAACAGVIQVTATLGTQTRTETLEMHCGE
jgi:hypothetical protein